MKVGDSSEATRTFTSRDLRVYAALSGHKGAMKSERVPGPLIDALISCVLSEQLPGNGAISLKLETRYQPGAVIGEPLTAKVEIAQLIPDEQMAELTTSCNRADGKVIARGRALVRLSDLVQESGED
jgi:hypothetical protein